MPKGKRSPDGMSDSEITSRLNVYIEKLGRCPADRELREVGDHALRYEIARRGGLKVVAAALGFKRSQLHAWDIVSARSAWAAGQEATGRAIPPKSWFEGTGRAGALTFLRRAASGDPARLAGLRETATWLATAKSDSLFDGAA